MIKLERTNASNKDFQILVDALDEGLKITDGDLNDFYHQYNGISEIKNAIVAHYDNQPVGCGAFKKYNDQTVEIKRMYVNPKFRGQKIASHVLAELEMWAKSLGYHKSILETGKFQVEALKFYPKAGYHIIPNYDQYAGLDNSICFEKIL